MGQGVVFLAQVTRIHQTPSTTGINNQLIKVIVETHLVYK